MLRVLLAAAALLCLSYSLSNAQYPTMKPTGYLQNWLIIREGKGGVANAPAPTDWGFRIRRARIGLNGGLSDLFGYDTEVELASSSNILMNLDIVAKIDTAFQVTVGQFKAPTQMYETGIVSASNLICMEFPDIVVRTASTLNLDSYRDVGLMASGMIGILKYRVYDGNGQGRLKFTQSSGIVARKFGEGLYGGRIDLTPAPNLSIGGHYGRNKQTTLLSGAAHATTVDRNTYSGSLNWSDPAGVLLRMEYGGGKNNDTPAWSKFSGAYVMVAGFITAPLQAMVRYSWIKVDSLNTPTAENSELVLGGTYYFMNNGVEIARLQLNYFFKMESSPAPSVDNDLFVAGLQVKW